MPKIKIDTQRCKGCLLCLSFCPQRLIFSTKKINKLGANFVEFKDPQGKCLGCSFCAIICPDCCIEVYK